MKDKKLIICFALLCMTGSVYAQKYLGVATGNYNTMGSLYLNPANIGACNEKVVVNIFSLGVGVDNSLGTFTNLSNIGNDNTNAFNLSGKEPFSMLIPVLEMRLPGVMISLNDKHRQAFALTTRVRAMNQFNHFDPSLYNTITSADHTSNENYTLQSTNFNWTAHVWSEIGLTYGLQVFQEGPHQVKAGVTLRYLGGIDYLSFKGKNLNATFTAGSDTLFADHSDLEFASNAIGSNDVKSNGVNSSDVLGSLFGSRSGSGFGMDIGVTYTYNVNAKGPLSGDDDKKESHAIKVSAAVTDIGSIKYKEGNNFFVDVTGDGYLTGKELSDHLGNYSEFRNYMVNQGFTADTGSKATTLHMPTALVAGADYQIYRRVYINATYIANLANRNNYGNSYYNQLTITPRYDYKLLTAALPITFSGLAHDVKVGFGFRIGGFFFGSDDMLAMFSNSQHGFGVYLGGFVPIYRKKEKESVR